MAFKGTTGLPILERGYVENQLWSLSTSVARSLGWWTDLLPSLTVDRERMLQAAGGYFAQATDLASALVQHRGLPWRTAHQIVGVLCRLAEERGLSPADVTPGLLDEAAIAYRNEPLGLEAEILEEALDAGRFPLRRTIFGGPAPSAVTAELETIGQGIRDDGERLGAARDRLDTARRLLERAIDDILRRTGGDAEPT